MFIKMYDHRARMRSILRCLDVRDFN